MGLLRWRKNDQALVKAKRPPLDLLYRPTDEDFSGGILQSLKKWGYEIWYEDRTHNLSRGINCVSGEKGPLQRNLRNPWPSIEWFYKYGSKMDGYGTNTPGL